MPPNPTLADQVSRLYDLVAGYHVTNLLEIARELGVWEALTQRPGLASGELAERLGTDPFYTDVLCRTAFSFGLVERDGEGWRMAPHFDQILGDPESSFYLACAPRVHMVVGQGYRDYPRHFRAGTRRSYQEHDEAFMREVAEALKALPRIFLDLVLPRLPGLAQRLIAERGLAGRCQARHLSVDRLEEAEGFDVVTSFLVVHEIAPEAKPGA